MSKKQDKEEKLKDKKRLSLDAAMASLNKRYGAAAIFTGKENIAVQVETWSSGCLSFDAALGAGIPRGRMIEISGAEGSGKTVFSASVIGYWQKTYGAKCAFIDGEQTALPKWFRDLGVNWDELIYSAPDYLEQVLDTIDMLASTGEVRLIVYDSIAALPSLAEASKDAGDVNVAALSKVLTSALRKLTPVLAKNDCTVIFINQLREKIGAHSSNPNSIPTTTPGGRALKHGCALRLEMKKNGKAENIYKEGTKVIGHQVDIKVKKNKLSSAQGAEASFDLYYSTGIDRVEDAVNTAFKIGVVERPNNQTYVFKELKERGYDNFMAKLRADKALFDDLVETTMSKMKSGTTFIEELPDVEGDDDSSDDED